MFNILLEREQALMPCVTTTYVSGKGFKEKVHDYYGLYQSDGEYYRRLDEENYCV